jgi:DNA repair exonuclease SbcCD nuclease subunit
MNLQHAKRAIIISDTHLGARSNSVEWLDVMKDWFYQDFIPKVKENYRPGDILIHCGDVFDNRQSVNLLVLHEGIRLFEELSKIFVDGIYVIAGNHDVMRKTTNDVSSLDTLKYIPNVNILKEPVIANFSTTTVYFDKWNPNSEVNYNQPWQQYIIDVAEFNEQENPGAIENHYYPELKRFFQYNSKDSTALYNRKKLEEYYIL